MAKTLAFTIAPSDSENGAAIRAEAGTIHLLFVTMSVVVPSQFVVSVL